MRGRPGSDIFGWWCFWLSVWGKTHNHLDDFWQKSSFWLPLAGEIHDQKDDQGKAMADVAEMKMPCAHPFKKPREL